MRLFGTIVGLTLAWAASATAAVAEPVAPATYRVELALSADGKVVGRPAITVRDGRAASVMVDGAGGYLFELRVASATYRGRPGADVTAKLSRRNAGGWTLLGNPRMVVALASPASMTVGPAGGTGGYALALTVTAAQAAPAAAPDYAQGAAWLCRPGRSDACTVDQDVTVVAADGARKVERFVAAKDPKFDCFYVYPTVSTDPGANSDMTADPAENQVVAAQAARFRAQCRVFAPLYRQVTLSALRAGMTSGAPITGRELAYGDVKAAWDSYLARDNQGRGVILFGHSQGSGILKQLIAREIEGKPVAARLIAAYLAGTNVVPGDLKSTPPCASRTQTGCVVAWVSFRSDAPPPANSRFGTGASPAICVNAATLGGGQATSRAIFSTTGVGAASAPMGPWSKDGPAIATPYVAVPGLISTECVVQGGFGYLSVTVNADPADPRTDTIVGDVMVGGQILQDWGLHLVDMPVVMGDLVALAGSQGAAWGKQRR